ncbi:MAG TPA: hypothetical protein VHK89_02155, partial [Actinomycetota bacterium]|nr:hypothetical protein [Actinomycetota bacterium]
MRTRHGLARLDHRLGLSQRRPRGPGHLGGVFDPPGERRDPEVHHPAGARVQLQPLPRLGQRQKLGLEVGVRLLHQRDRLHEG